MGTEFPDRRPVFRVPREIITWAHQLNIRASGGVAECGKEAKKPRYRLEECFDPPIDRWSKKNNDIAKLLFGTTDEIM